MVTVATPHTMPPAMAPTFTWDGLDGDAVELDIVCVVEVGDVVGCPYADSVSEP